MIIAKHCPVLYTVFALWLWQCVWPIRTPPNWGGKSSSQLRQSGKQKQTNSCFEECLRNLTPETYGRWRKIPPFSYLNGEKYDDKRRYILQSSFGRKHTDSFNTIDRKIIPQKCFVSTTRRLLCVSNLPLRTSGSNPSGRTLVRE